MTQFFRVFAGVLVAAFVVTSVTPAMAQEKAKAEKGLVVFKVLAENDKLKAQEITWKPGDVNKSVSSSATRVNRVLKGGTLLLTYASGKTETVVRKTGQVYILGPSEAFTAKNVGKSEVVLYNVMLK